MEINRIYNIDAKTLVQNIFSDGGVGKYIIVTDPPFNVWYHYEWFYDKQDEDVYYNDLTKILTCIWCPFVVIHYPESLYKLSYYTKTIPTKVVSRVYNSNTAKQHRDIWFFNIKPDFNKVKQPYKNPQDKRIKKRIAEWKTWGRLYDWWNINQVKNVSKKNIWHPCVMPLEVMTNIIGILPQDYIIIDPYMWSWTTAVACKKLNRNFIGCEINPDYIKIAEKRIAEENSKLILI